MISSSYVRLTYFWTLKSSCSSCPGKGPSRACTSGGHGHTPIETIAGRSCPWSWITIIGVLKTHFWSWHMFGKQCSQTWFIPTPAWYKEDIDRPFQSLDFLVRDWRHFRCPGLLVPFDGERPLSFPQKTMEVHLVPGMIGPWNSAKSRWSSLAPRKTNGPMALKNRRGLQIEELSWILVRRDSCAGWVMFTPLIATDYQLGEEFGMSSFFQQGQSPIDSSDPKRSP